jgi:hypothetical protein
MTARGFVGSLPPATDRESSRRYAPLSHPVETSPPSPQTPPLPRRLRHRPWFIPAVVVGGVVLFAGLMALMLGVFVGALKSSDAYEGALARTRSAPAVIAVLGTPIEAGYFVTGTIHVSGPTGLAELAIPVSGPRGRATVYVEAAKRLGDWHFDHLVVQVERTGARIDLAPGPPPAPSRP